MATGPPCTGGEQHFLDAGRGIFRDDENSSVGNCTTACTQDFGVLLESIADLDQDPTAPRMVFIITGSLLFPTHCQQKDRLLSIVVLLLVMYVFIGKGPQRALYEGRIRYVTYNLWLELHCDLISFHT